MPVNSLIIGVDLAPIKSIPKVITFQSDITTEKCRATIRTHLKTWKADVFLHDGAPNVGTAWVQDAFTQSELVLQSLKLATEFLMPGGTFVTKVFRSRDFNNLMWVFNQLFNKVEATKPPSSRNVSAEIFVVCRGFKAPKKMDPKFLDPRSVFEELPDAAPNNEAKVFQPEKKRRKRDGYEEGDYLLYKEAPINEFIETTDPIQMLGSLNKLSFEEKPNSDLAIAAISKLPETTAEIKECCQDLRVLGKKDFRKLLKWRLSVREKFGLVKKAPLIEEAEVEPMDEEMQLEEDLQRMKDRESATKKKSKKKGNEAKRKEIVRMQLHMGTPMDIGMEQDMGSMFGLKTVDKHGPDALKNIVKGKMNFVVEDDDKPEHKDVYMGELLPGADDSEEETENRLEEELDELYLRYQERKAESDAKFKARKARKEHEDGEWTGFSDGEMSVDEGDDEVAEHEISSDDESDDEAGGEQLIKKLDGAEIKGEDGLSKRAAIFFDQDIFAGISEDEEDEEDEEEEGDEAFNGFDSEGEDEEQDEEEDEEADVEMKDAENESEDDGIEFVKAPKDERWDADEEPTTKDGRLGIQPPSLMPFPMAASLTIRFLRHRHHHCGSHDTRSAARYRRKDQARPDRRRLQQVVIP
jgi:AdoMet-dependent rRNA methyltransferase SPB1